MGIAKRADRIVRENLPLVRAVAIRYRRYGLPLDDLVQEGSIGLLRAIDNCDPARGARFDVYARTCVRRAIANALSVQARVIRLPRPVVDRRRLVAKAVCGLAAAGREPTSDAIAAETGLRVSDITGARNAASAPVSLDYPPSRDGLPLEALISDPSAKDPGPVRRRTRRTKTFARGCEPAPRTEA